MHSSHLLFLILSNSSHNLFLLLHFFCTSSNDVPLIPSIILLSFFFSFSLGFFSFSLATSTLLFPTPKMLIHSFLHSLLLSSFFFLCTSILLFMSPSSHFHSFLPPFITPSCSHCLDFSFPLSILPLLYHSYLFSTHSSSLHLSFFLSFSWIIFLFCLPHHFSWPLLIIFHSFLPPFISSSFYHSLELYSFSLPAVPLLFPTRKIVFHLKLFLPSSFSFLFSSSQIIFLFSINLTASLSHSFYVLQWPDIPQKGT